MDIAVLNPQDCLKNPLTKQPLMSPHMKKHHQRNPNTNHSNRTNGTTPPRQPNRRRRSPTRASAADNSRATVVQKVPAKNLVMGQVKILKRGEELNSNSNNNNNNNNGQTAPSKDLKGGKPNQTESDLGSTKRLGPDPESVPTQIRLNNDSKNNDHPGLPVAASFYAGSAFTVNSPPPSSLPLPAFFTKKLVDAKNVDDAASRILKRVLRLDLQ